MNKNLKKNIIIQFIQKYQKKIMKFLIYKFFKNFIKNITFYFFKNLFFIMILKKLINKVKQNILIIFLIKKKHNFKLMKMINKILDINFFLKVYMMNKKIKKI